MKKVNSAHQKAAPDHVDAASGINIPNIVKIDSKYKEDDFSDSNADVNSQCLCTQEASTPHVSNPRSP